MPAVTRRRRGEAGYVLVTVLGAMVVIALMTVAAFAAVDGDARESGKDVARKQALAAAEAGVNQYLYQLNGDNDYWAKCTTMTAPNAVNDVWNGVPPDPRKWATVPGASTQYTIELLPANGYSKCTPGSKVADSMIDADSRSLRIRVTGRAQSVKGLVTRSVVAALKRDSFLDFLWFTDYETSDPIWYSVRSNGRPTGGAQGDLMTWAANNCPEYYRKPWQRGLENWDGSFTDKIPAEGYPGSVGCDNISFITGDKLLGPMHTNDEPLTCGTPVFGRNAQDRIESGNGYRTGCSGTPDFQGTLVPDSGTIGMPATNATLANVAAAGGYTFNGPTTIVFGTAPGKISVTNAAKGYTNEPLSYPGNGVIYVATNGTCSPYSALRPSYSSREVPPFPTTPSAFPPAPNVSGCGDALIRGSYDTDVTIATQNDIIATGDVIRNASGDAMLGLIADGFVRVEHDTNNFTLSTPPGDPDCVNVAAGDRRIDAAILTLLHSFTVDRYYCGDPIGKLTVNGMIAQKFRGAVGKNSGGAVVHGFLKDYVYDPRLAFRSPPHFLDPVKSAWHVHRYTEQEPAAK
jgi:Tfp pilus assembly protein PilX